MARMPAAQKPSIDKQERAYKLLRRRIERGEFAPGQRIIIDALAREFGMSQVPIREAIRRLEAGGWIAYRRNTGPVVAQVTRERWEAGMEVLAVSEGYATALAAPHVTASDLAQLKKLNRAMSDALKAVDLLEFSRCNREFHATVYRRCPNQYLVDQLNEVQSQLDSIRRTVFTIAPQRGWASIEEHSEILAAIEEGKRPDQIEKLCRQHKLNTVRAAKEYGDRLDHQATGGL